MSARQSKLSRLTERVRASNKAPVRIYSDESGCFFSDMAGAQQLTREQVQALTQSTGVICFVAKLEPERKDDWSRIIDS